MKREWLYAMLALGAGIAGGMLGSRLNGAVAAAAVEAAPKSLAAHEILLIGPNGRPRAALRMTKSGEPSLEFLDHAGQAARFGSALRGLWRSWCEKRAERAA